MLRRRHPCLTDPREVRNLRGEGPPQEHFAWGELEGEFCEGIAWGRLFYNGSLCGEGVKPEKSFFVRQLKSKKVDVRSGARCLWKPQMSQKHAKLHQNGWRLRGDEKMIYTFCGAGVGLPTQGFVEWGAPHTIPKQGFLSGDCVGRISVGE